MKIKRLLIYLFFICFLGSGVAYSAPLYLSYEQRVLLTYSIQSAGKSAQEKKSILRKAARFIYEHTHQPRHQVVVSNFEEFLNSFRGEWPNTHKVELDLGFIEEKGARGGIDYVSQSPRVQRKIDKYLLEQHENLLLFLDKVVKTHSNELNPVVDDTLTEIQQSLAAQTEDTSFKKEVIEILRISSDEILGAVLSRIDTVGEKIGEMAFSENDRSANQIIFTTLFKEYYSNLSLNSKKLIVSAFLGEDLYSEDFHRFEVLIQNSGPQLQKILQIVARQAEITEDLKTVFKVLESSVRAVPYHLVEKLLASEQNNYQFTYFERKPLGVGTLAQVHRAKLLDEKGNEHDVVVRFIKPDIEERIEEDHWILSKFAQILDANEELRKLGAPRISSLIEEVTNTVRNELDLPATKQRQRQAKVYEQKILINLIENKFFLNVKVPGVYEPKTGKSKLHVQELAIGKKFDKELLPYEDLYPEIKVKIAEAFARAWLEEAFFKSGFYHSDVHQGNFLVNVKEGEIDLIVLDFGMGGTLSKSIQENLMLFGVASDLKKADIMTKAFLRMTKSDDSLATSELVQVEIQKHLDLEAQGLEPSKNLEEWTALIVNQGVKIPYEFVNMNRGVVIINRFLKEVGSHQSALEIIKDLALHHPMKTVFNVRKSKEINYNEIFSVGLKEVEAKVFPPKALKCENVLSSQSH